MWILLKVSFIPNVYAPLDFYRFTHSIMSALEKEGLDLYGKKKPFRATPPRPWSLIAADRDVAEPLISALVRGIRFRGGIHFPREIRVMEYVHSEEVVTVTPALFYRKQGGKKIPVEPSVPVLWQKRTVVPFKNTAFEAYNLRARVRDPEKVVRETGLGRKTGWGFGFVLTVPMLEQLQPPR